MKKLSILMLLISLLGIVGAITMVFVHIDPYTLVSAVAIGPLIIMLFSSWYIWNQSSVRGDVIKTAATTNAQWGTSIPASWHKSNKTGYKYQYYWNFLFVVITWYFIIGMALPHIINVSGVDILSLEKHDVWNWTIGSFYRDWLSAISFDNLWVKVAYSSMGLLLLLFILRIIVTKSTRRTIHKATTGNPPEIKVWGWKTIVFLIVLLLLPLIVLWFIWKFIIKRKRK